MDEALDMTLMLNARFPLHSSI